MKKNYLLLASLLFCLLAGYNGFGQSTTYTLTTANLVNVEQNCGNGNVYSCSGNGSIGLSYVDALPCGAVPTSITVTFTQGVNCVGNGNEPYYFNGAFNGNFYSPYNCDCNFYITNAFTVSCSASNYNVGGTNTFALGTAAGCLGLYYLNNNGSGIYAQVTVNYTLGSTGCNLGAEGNHGTPVAANCSPTWAFAGNCGPGATFGMPAADVLANTYYDFQVSTPGVLASPSGIYVGGTCQTTSSLYSSYVSGSPGVTIGTDRICGPWSAATSSILQYRYSAPSVTINTGTGATAAATVCPGATTSYTISTSNVSASGTNPYTWSINSTTGTASATIGSAGTASPNVTFTNSGGTAGTVTIKCTVTNNNKCSATATTFTVTVNGALAATATGGSTTICSGTSPGTFTATATGGGGTYTYQWFNSSGSIGGATASTYTAPTLTANNQYYCAVTSSGGCGNVNTNTISVTVNATVGATIAGGSSTICYGTSPGTFTAIGSGGNGTYTYQWFNTAGSIGGATASTYTAPSLTANDGYHVVVTSGGGCGSATSSTSSVTVRPQFTASTTGGTSPICTGTSPGTFTTTASGGAGGYTYQWYNSSGPIGGATASTYTAPTITASTQYYTIVTDGSCGSITTTAVPITVQAPTVTTGGALAAICQGGTTAALGGSFGGTATAATWDDGGAGGSFTNNTGSTPATTTYTAAANAPASVTLTLTTSGGSCGTASASKTLTVNPNPTVNAGGAVAAICQGGTTGALGGSFGGGASSATWTDGGAGGTFNNNTGTTPGTATYTAAANAPSTVTLTLTTAGGSCGTTSANKTVTVNPNPTANAGPGVAAICQGGTTAALGGSFGGGATSAVWSDGGAGGSFANNTGTTPGTTTYTATANSSTPVTLTLTTSGGSCGTTSASISLTVNPNPTVNAGPPLAPMCQGATTPALGGSYGGGATLATWDDGGAGGSFANNGGSTPGTATYTASTTAPASITLTLTTFGGSCGVVTASKSISINPLPLVDAGPAVAAVCQGGTSVALGGSFSGGATSATWSDGGAGGTFANNSGSTPGTTTYTSSITSGTPVTLTLTTAGGVCGTTSASKQIVVYPNPIINSASVSPALCNGSSTGSITVNASNGLPAYNYSIDSGATTQSSNVFSNLPAGTDYVLEVSDSRGCYSFYASNPVTITQPTVLTQTDSSTTASCANVFDGSITVTAAGGITPYSYSINGGPSQSGNTFSNLGAGNYVVQVADANGCTDTAHVTINNSYAVSDSLLSQTNVSCFGSSDGALTVQLTGGVPNYSYSDNGSTFQSSPTFTGLSAGNYVITLRDSRGCSAFITTTITQPALLTIQIDSIQNVLCSGQGQGAIYITVNGGTTPYTYNWSNGATTQDVTGLSAGTYNVTVLDNNGCNSSSGATITQPLPLFVNVATYHNLSCYNDSSGYVYINVSGGVPPYTYNWSNGATTQDISVLGANTYTVTVLDNNACQDTISQVITQPTQLTSTIAATSVTCNGAANGSVTFTPAGGTPAYTYQWNNGATTQSLTNVSGGFYQVTLHDANGCSLVNSATVTEPSALVVSISSTNASCNGGGNATVTTTVTGGTGTYSYNWSNGATTANLTNVNAGSYSVVVTDANNCTASASVTVSQPAALVLNGTVSNVLCNGGNTGSVAITVNGGTFPYSYSWSNGATTQNINGVSANTYIVNVTDANSCNTSASFTVSEPTAITSSVVGTDVTCHGQANGTATLTVNGGTPGYTFNWSNFQATQNLSGLSGGTYYVIITDANGCTKRDSVIINEPAAIVLGISSTDVTCNGGTNGSVTTTVSGGTGTINYNWSNSATTANLTNVGAGTYSVVINDANGCTASASATISQPTALVLNGTVANVLCNGGSNGSVAITVNGGVFPYTYSWSNGATTQNINNVSANTYTVVATDANLCQISASFTVTEPTAITSSVVGTNVTCHGQANGTATLTVSGGTTPYSYLWSNFQATQNLTGLSGGTYYVIITDANGCTRRDSVTITEPAAIVLTVSSTDVSCNGGSNGSVTTTVSGGTGTINYNWSNGATTANLNNVGAGSYSVVITDANGCTASASATVSQPTALAINGTAANVSCNGGSNGSVAITVNGGVFPYTYSWSNGATTQNINGVSANTYTVNATDANGCSISASFTVTEPTAITSSIVGTNVTCHGQANGTATLTVNGGTPGYTFNWSNFQATQNLTGLSGGTYYVIITDANGCTKRDSVIITEPAAIVLTVTSTNVTCNGANNGTATSTVSGGTGTITYAWSNGATTANLTNVGAGTYTLVITDANSCSASASVTITEPTALVLNGTVANVLCAGGNNGSISITVNGGVFPYTYSWSNGATTQNVNNLPGGVTYTVTATDANLCTITASFNVTSPTALSTSITGTDVTCFGAKNGTASVTVTGGTTPYTYLWSDFRGTPSIDSLNGGEYFVIVTDNNGCSAKDSITINEPAQIIITAAVTPITCNNANNGAINLTVIGGVPNFNYSWNPTLSNSGNQTGLGAGTYLVTVTDAHSCSASASVNISNPPAIAINYVVTNPKCYGDSNGSVNLIVSGGVPAYGFAWSNGETTEQLTNVPVGTYYVTVSDAAGCSAIDSANVASPTQLYTSGVIKNVSCAGAHDGQILVTVYGGTLPYQYQWSPPSNATTKDLYNLSGSNNILTVTDANGCHVSSLYIVHEPTALTLGLAATNVSCFGGSNGTVASVPAGGTKPYRYLWNNFSPDSMQTGLTAGLYSLQLTDSNSCYAFDSILITQPTQITLTAFINNVTCFNTATGALDVIATGGTPGYTYGWSSGSSDSAINTLSAGPYTVTVTDSKNCTVTSVYTVDQAPKIIIDMATYDPICYGGNTGGITALVSGGLQPYQFSWSSGAADTSVSVGHLVAGTYTVTITDHAGCVTAANATLNQPDAITLTPSVTGAKCFNAATGVVIATTTGGTAPYNYSLNGIGQANDTFTHVLPGHYDLVTTDVNGCQGVDTFTILAPNTIAVTLSVTDQVIVTGMQTQLSAAATSTSAILNYFWSPLVVDSAEVFDFSGCGDSLNCSAPYVKPPFTQTFTVTVMNADSCTASDTVTVIVNASENPSFFPTAFTPNGDGLNDRFTFAILGATTIDVTVYDRWGQRVYSDPTQPNGVSNSYGWDGTSAGKNCPEDTYVYQLKVTYFDGTTKNKAGTITLMR